MTLVVASTEAAVLMVESEAQNLSEKIMLGGVMFGHEQMQAAINAIHDLVAEAGKPEWDWKPAAKNEALTTAVAFAAQRSEERRVGKECVSTCRSRWSR